ncbi:biogenesis of lysosome-related organelles complex 1 subunit 4 [Anopheles aquasalis]|uniref:biogenesis of lysosome-related organelles complex 1 subunit 4 n=1 Tax=Anopheles aquasalis TaxID=42839 RepID=UPI00215B0EEB|nr:biogenesis of lysosome-related organelles complex 1 subunit 4 [Anopheles aquasalis]
MAEELANDYSAYFQTSNLDQELKPVVVGIDRMMLRLEEFENCLELVKAESAVALTQNIPRLVALRPGLNALCERIDRLEQFVAMVGKNLDAVEKQVQIAEEELDIPDKTLNVLLKSLNFFGKPKPTDRPTNRNAETGIYEPVPVFKTEQYFRPNGPEAEEEARDDGDDSEAASPSEDCDTGTPEK